jgi:NADPH2:quinone reductase
MKAVLCKAFGPPESLVLEDMPAPVPGKGEVLIDVHAAGMNFPDSLMLAGKYQFKPAFPFAPGGEVGGVVAAVGEGVTRVKPGDRVMGVTMWGACAEQIVIAERKVMKIPATMPFDVAAGFGVVYGTSYHALADRGHLKAGETLLVHGSAGGVGLAAVELGKAMGATVIATASTEEKLAIAKAHGADHGVLSTDGFKDKVKELTGGRGADVIYDPVGGDVFDQSLRCIAWEGRLLVVGFASGRIPEAPANLLLLKGCQLVGVFWGQAVERDPAHSAASFAQMFKWFEEGKLKPLVSHHFALADAGKAIRMLMDRKATGKLIVQVRT